MKVWTVNISFTSVKMIHGYSPPSSLLGPSNYCVSADGIPTFPCCLLEASILLFHKLATKGSGHLNNLAMDIPPKNNGILSGASAFCGKWLQTMIIIWPKWSFLVTFKKTIARLTPRLTNYIFRFFAVDTESSGTSKCRMRIMHCHSFETV
jgi:hypothetical protein